MPKFDVEFYDDNHKELLRSATCFDKLDSYVQTGFEINDDDFMVYTFFREQKNFLGFRNFHELKEQLGERRRTIFRYFDLSDGTVRSVFSVANTQDKTRTEACGVGATLSVVSSALGLTEADWERIDETQVKDLDFRRASTGDEFIEVESKGTVEDSRKKTRNISDHMGDIRKKKVVQRKQEDNQNLLIGVICAFPSEGGLNALIRLLDPPMTGASDDPRKHKLLARLSYYWREHGVIVQRSQLRSALANRIQAISRVAGYESLNRQPLVNAAGRRLNLPRSLFSSRSVSLNERAVGVIVPDENGSPYFYGYDASIHDLLITQDFDRILDFVSPIQKLDLDFVMARLSQDECDEFELSTERASYNEWTRRFDVPMDAELVATASGRVIGPLFRR